MNRGSIAQGKVENRTGDADATQAAPAPAASGEPVAAPSAPELRHGASWCVPCKDEAPRLAASARAHAGRVVFLGVDVQDFTSDARRFLGRYGANYPSVRDVDGKAYTRYGLTGVPETYYLDRRGRVVAHAPGEVSRRELEAGVAQAAGSGG